MFYQILESLELVVALKDAVEAINNTRIKLIGSWIEVLQVAGKSKETSKRHYVYGLKDQGCDECFVTLPISKDVKTYADLAELVKEWGEHLEGLHGWKEAKIVKAIAHDLRKSSDIEQRTPFRPESISAKPKNLVVKPKDMKNVNVLTPEEMEEARLEGLRMAEKVYKAKIAAKIAKQAK